MILNSVLERDGIEQLDKTASVFGKVVYDNSPDPEVKYVSVCYLIIHKLLLLIGANQNSFDAKFNSQDLLEFESGQNLQDHEAKSFFQDTYLCSYFWVLTLIDFGVDLTLNFISSSKYFLITHC